MEEVIICGGSQPQRPNPADTLQTLLDLCEDYCADFLVANGGGDPNVPRWYALGYWYEPQSAPPEEGHWEIDVKGDTLREVLCAFIADPRFGQ